MEKIQTCRPLIDAETSQNLLMTGTTNQVSMGPLNRSSTAYTTVWCRNLISENFIQEEVTLSV